MADGLHINLEGEDAFCTLCQYNHGKLDFSELDDLSLEELESIESYTFSKGITSGCYEYMLAKTNNHVSQLEAELETADDDD